VRLSPRIVLASSIAALLLAGCSYVHVPLSPSAPGKTKRLPVRTMPAAPGAEGRVFALVLTGDGPVRGLGDRLGRTLARGGVPSAVWSSLRYYWTPRTPEEAAADLDRLVRYFGAEWGRDRVVLVGYSMGADVLPFLVTRLPPETRARVAGIALLALADDAPFEFRLEQWWGDTGAPTLPTLPEVARLDGIPLLCVHGRGDVKSVCPRLADSGVRVVELRGGHHFEGDHARLKALVVEMAMEAERGSAER
jgi:type IV secretory pathway VirJ component